MLGFPQINYVSKDGTITFQDGITVDADIIFHCTGYKLQYPFLKTNGIVTIQDKRIGPLYKHVFPPQLAPKLSFVSIPEQSFTFSIIECQSRWIAHTLSKKVSLPSEEEMLGEVEKYYEEMKEKGIPEHLTHYIGFQIGCLLKLEWLWTRSQKKCSNILSTVKWWVV
ncbi:flavin monooxygenase-like, FAD/NAD(P)-binding domain protein [Artemisia annua]|uniref:Flavin-containing monooxygenase n=1 Tax=Artemisia annua TaxID=35608 RepID=A0A2U1NFN4_ARTAN|nr:flavin monooxygenase-like, FAD/NAD(P)-binding domain protein [Artemisia annua]